MPRQFGDAGSMGPGCAEFAAGRGEGGDFYHRLHPLRRQLQTDLAPAGKLDIDLGKQLSVEQRAVLDPVAAIDAVASAQRIERMLGPRMAPSSDRQRVDHSFQRNFGMAAGAELAIEEAEIELRVVRDERRIGEEIEQIEHAFMESRLVREEGIAQPVDLLGFERAQFRRT